MNKSTPSKTNPVQHTRTTRRGFLKTAGAVAAPFILPSGLLHASPNERVRLGCIGMGRRMRQIMLVPRREAELVAMADVHRGRLEELQRLPMLRDATPYTDYREMLERDDIDAVLVATPDHWHTLPSLHAMEAGKHVYIEKPMTLTIREGQLLVGAARKHDRVVQVGSQQRSMDENRQACEWIRNGRLGEIHTVHAANYPSPWDCALPEQPVPDGLDWDTWCGQTEPRPYHIDLYLPRAEGRRDAQDRRLGWISYRPYSGGEMTGWGAHGLDQIQWALGMDESGPVEMWPEGEGVFAPISMKYANGTVVKFDDKGDGGGGLFEGSEGTLRVDRGSWKVEAGEPDLSPAIKPGETALERSDNHMKNFLDCMRSRQQPIADVARGHRSTTMCHLGNITRWTGRHLRWNPQTERFIDDDEANGYLHREGREPYQIA